MQQADTTVFRYVGRKQASHTSDRPRWLQQRMVPAVNALLRSSTAQRIITPLVSPRRIDDYLELVDPCWSLSQVRARVVDVRRESSDVTSLLLQPNGNWRGHRAGQHVQLTVTVDGVQQTRTFTLSCAPRHGDPLEPLRLTVKAHANGHVSRWIKERARVGDVVTLSQAGGELVLPAVLPSELLFISGGSGFTPMIAMAQALVQARYQGALVWLHYELDEVPLEDELRALMAQLPNARLVVERTEPKATSSETANVQPAPLLTDARLEQLVPAWSTHETFLCGPPGMMKSITAMYARAGLTTRLHTEHFQAAWKSQGTLAVVTGQRHLVFARSGKQSDARPGVSLLEQAERAGLHPPHGCRMGICHSCTCKKLSGTVRNELTGETSDARDEDIQLCIHTPLSDVSLDL